MATINLTQLTRPAANTNVQFDKPGELNLTAGHARDLLTQIRAQITAGGTVQTGYLSLQRADNGEFTIENRSRFNAFGDKDGAAALVKNLIRIAYGDSIGTESTGKLENAMDAYLADKSFGKKLGTVSFVRLINALEVNVRTQSAPAADKKSWAQSLLGAGGSLAVDVQSIAEGALKIRGVHDQVGALREVTQGLMSHGTVDAIPDALAQFTAHGDLAAKIIEGYQGNQTLQGLAGMLKSEQTALAAKLNMDISARVDTLRPPGQQTGLRGVAELQGQIDGLQALRLQLTQGQDSPILAATLGKLDAALAQARIELGFAESMVELATATQPLLAQGTDTADRISDATAQIHAHVALEQALTDNTEGLEHPGLAPSIAQLATRRAELCDRLNTDISKRVDTIRPPGQGATAASLSLQVSRLRALKGDIEAHSPAAQGPVTRATREKVAAALDAAEKALQAVQAWDQPEAVSAKGLIKQTLDRLGLRADTPSARATSRLGEHDIPWALHQHQALSKGIGALKAAIDAMADKPAAQAELAGLQASLRETQGKLAERINADITLIVADCKASATAAASGRQRGCPAGGLQPGPIARLHPAGRQRPGAASPGRFVRQRAHSGGGGSSAGRRDGRRRGCL